MKQLNDNMINLLNMSSKAIHNSAESIKCLIDKWQKLQASKCFDEAYVDLDNIDNGNQGVDENVSCSQARVNLKKSIEKAKIDMQEMKNVAKLRPVGHRGC